MSMIKVSAVSFANALPMVYGITHAPNRPQIDLSLDIPYEGARKLIAGECDMALMPVGAIRHLPYYEILPGYCVGAENLVRTVRLFSEVPVEEVETICLDHQSRTSVVLVKILAKYLWKIYPTWKNTTSGYEQRAIAGKTAAVVIGDKVFSVENKYTYSYDLAFEWIKYTGNPFVFAVWVTTSPLDPTFIRQFNEAIAFGIEHVRDAIDQFPENPDITKVSLEKYLRENISYPLDTAKMRGMHLFMEMAKEF
jgi:chorismate dehydratase